MIGSPLSRRRGETRSAGRSVGRGLEREKEDKRDDEERSSESKEGVQGRHKRQGGCVAIFGNDKMIRPGGARRGAK